MLSAAGKQAGGGSSEEDSEKCDDSGRRNVTLIHILERPRPHAIAEVKDEQESVAGEAKDHQEHVDRNIDGQRIALTGPLE